MTLAPIIMIFMIWGGITHFGLAGYEFTLFEYVMMFFFVTGNITAIQRGVKTWREIKG